MRLDISRKTVTWSCWSSHDQEVLLRMKWIEIELEVMDYEIESMLTNHSYMVSSSISRELCL